MKVRNNSIFTIRPYMKEGVWMFDDDTVGVKEEPFVSGADDMITHLANAVGIRDFKHGIILQFSSQSFPDAIAALNFVRHEGGGTWYRLNMQNRTISIAGWLCSVLNLYYPTSPRNLYVAVKPRK